MSRHLYSNVFRKIADFLLGSIAVVSLFFFVCSWKIDNTISVSSLIVFSSCLAIWVVSFAFLALLDQKSRKIVVFEKNRIKCQGKTRYKHDLHMKYFSFHISLIDPSLVFPKLHISSNDFSVTCYLSKRDVKKLEKLGYAIKRV